MSGPEFQTERALPGWLLPSVLISFVALMSVIVFKAFVLEDSFIVLRSVQNFHSGFYLSAIADVRSQSFTSNLWTLLLVLGGYISADLPNVAVAISLVCTFITALLLTNFFVLRRHPLLSIAVLVMLALSNTFTDYSTSGLENPLSHLILVLFFLYYWSKKRKDVDFFFLCSLAGFLTANRYDLVLLVLPVLGETFFYRYRWKQDLAQAFLGFMPLWLWMGFAWFYFGSIFPDTYFAKMKTGVPVVERVNLAVLHHVRMMDMDFFGMLLMLVVMGWGLYHSASLARRLVATPQVEHADESKTKIVAIVFGIIFYNLYFFYAGGDFMAGRFMSVAILSTILVVIFIIEGGYLSGQKLKMALIVTIALCLFKLTIPHFFAPGYGAGSPGRIMRALTFDYRHFPQNWRFLSQSHDGKDWRQIGLERALSADTAPYPLIVEHKAGGIIPFYAGPRHRLIDLLGLSDPLLSRLPCSVLGAAAHCMRLVPDGYAHFIQTGKLDQMDDDLAHYTEVLFKIKTLPLFDLARLKLLVSFSLGKFDVYRQAYIAKYSNDFYKPGAGKPLFRQAYNQTFLAPLLGSHDKEATANPLEW